MLLLFSAQRIPKVSPPEDGNISHFSVRQIAGLMRHFEFRDQAVTHCLAKRIDGKKLCDMSAKMDDEILKRELGIESSYFFALKYLITRSLGKV